MLPEMVNSALMKRAVPRVRRTEDEVSACFTGSCVTRRKLTQKGAAPLLEPPPRGFAQEGVYPPACGAISRCIR